MKSTAKVRHSLNSFLNNILLITFFLLSRKLFYFQNNFFQVNILKYNNKFLQFIIIFHFWLSYEFKWLNLIDIQIVRWCEWAAIWLDYFSWLFFHSKNSIGMGKVQWVHEYFANATAWMMAKCTKLPLIRIAVNEYCRDILIFFTKTKFRRTMKSTCAHLQIVN